MVVVEIDASKVLRGLDKLDHRLADLRPAFAAAVEVAYRSVRQNFAVGGRPRWPALAPSTLMRKIGGKRRGHTKRGALRARSRRILAQNKILIDTGRLLNSIAMRIGASLGELGTNVVYARTHQFGRGHIPARPYLMLQPEDPPRIIAEIERVFAEVLK